jgi:hypothetical protein
MHSGKIVILLHKNDAAFRTTKYLARLLMRVWENMGLTVEVIRGTGQVVPADLLIPHIDLTITPMEYRDFLCRYSVVVNRHVVDISKSKISPHILERNDTYTGPVIVKTDRNYGGIPEKTLFGDPRLSRATLSRLIGKIVPKLSWKLTGSWLWKYVECMEIHDYPVCASLQEVPQAVFNNKNLIVEKFLPEMEGDSYCLRYYYFFGDKYINLLFRSKNKVSKGDEAFKFEEAPVPPELVSIRQQLGFDYGKFDYVLRDGKVVLYDVNRTPAFTVLEALQLSQKVASHLATGIWSMLN